MVAATLSALAHVIIGILAFGALRGDPQVSEGRQGGDLGDMTVTLVSAPSQTPHPSDPASGALTPLFARFDTGATPVSAPVKSEGDLDMLLRRVRTAAPPTIDHSDVPREPSSANSDSLAAGERAEKPGASGGGGGLWGTVEPCWKTLAQRSTIPVTLDVTLDATGAVSTPPQIIRSPGTIVNERQLQAEARALTALSACMSHGEPRFGGRVYRLQFRPVKR